MSTSLVDPSAISQRRLPRAALLLACILFFASGMAGLIYEVVWVRLLTTIFGSGIYAISAVLAAFMAGLSLGAVCLGPWSDRLSRPLAFYAVLEILIAGTGLLVPSVLGHLAGLESWAYARWGQSSTVLTACRFTAALGLLLVPTTLMGATLPVMARALVRGSEHLGTRVGALYAMNTAGAIAGTFLSGFYFLGRFGVARTELIAVLLNLLAGAGALALCVVFYGRRSTDRPLEIVASPADQSPAARTAPSRQDAGRSASGLVLASAFVTGLVALAAQVLWSRSLVFVFDNSLKNTTYCFSAMLTVFLTGLALGGAAIGVVIDRLSAPLKVYGALISALGVSIALSAVLLREPALSGTGTDAAGGAFSMSASIARMMFQSAVVLGVPTLLMGMAFPAAVKAIACQTQVGRDVGWLYGLNTAGAVLGSLAAAFVVVPLFGLTHGLLLLGMVDVAAGVFIVWRAEPSVPRRIGSVLLPVAAVGAVAAWLPPRGALESLQPGESLIHYEESPVATVSVIEDEFGHRRICVDDVPVAGTSSIMQTDQKSLAHLPMALVKNPRAALTVGFGSGGASHSFLLHDALEQVDCVEICPAVVRAAPYLTDANHGLLERGDPRYRVILDDARAYLRYTDRVYDVISTDCTDLRYKSSANLYDLEYFQLCRERLRRGGVVTVWMPLGGLSQEMFRLTLRTFHRAFPEMGVFYMHNEWTHYVLLVGWRDSMSIEFRRIWAVAEEPDVRADLAEIGMDDPFKLLATFVTGGSPLRRLLAGDEVNTQDRPVLEFEGPRQARTPDAAPRNLAQLLRYRTSVLPWIVPESMTAEQFARFEQYERAVPYILAGQRYENNYDLEAATRAYLAALELTPEDRHLRDALEFARFRPLANQNPTVWAMLGRSQQIQGNHPRAVEMFDRYFTGYKALATAREERPDDSIAVAIARQTFAWFETASRWRYECLTHLQTGTNGTGEGRAVRGEAR